MPQTLTFAVPKGRILDEALPVMQVLECGPITPGQPTADGAQCAYQSLEAAVVVNHVVELLVVEVQEVIVHQVLDLLLLEDQH